MQKRTLSTTIQILMLPLFAVLLTACGSTMSIKNVDFSQPIETVLVADRDANVQDVRGGINFNLTEVLKSESISKDAFMGTEVRLIRNHQGYYFLTATGFNHVYVFETEENELKLLNKIRVTSQGLQNPAFNQRMPYIQLIDGDIAVSLTKDRAIQS